MKLTEEKSYTLAITAEEKEWLKGLMQNPISCDGGESQLDNEMRSAFWVGLGGSLMRARADIHE